MSLMTMRPLGQLLEGTHGCNRMMHSASMDLGELEVGKLASGNNFLMGYRNCRSSHVSCVSDTALSTARMRACILKEITEYG